MRTTKSISLFSGALLASGASMFALTPAAAQTAQNGAAAQSATSTLDEIVVTAQRTRENAQSVPIAINVVTGKDLESTSYQSLTDLQYVVPGVQYDPTQGSAFQIRGVGSTSFDFSNEKSVNVVVDDVVMDAQRDNGLTGLEDVSRVEVLYGPQGTLFGKNSTSGVISVTTNDPVLHKLSFKANGSYGQRNDRTIHATVNVPLGNTAALRISGFDQGQDGYGNYVTLKRNLGLVNEYGVRAKLLWEPTSRLQFILAGDIESHHDTSVRVSVGGPVGTSFSAPASVLATEAALGVTPGPENADDADSSLGYINTVDRAASLHVKYDLGGATLTSITALRGTLYVNSTPADLVPTSTFAYIPYNIGHLTTHKFSEEIHLASKTGHFFEYLLGGFYNNLSAEQTQIQWGPLGAPITAATTTLYALTGAKDAVTGALLGNIVDFKSSNKTYAVFGQVKLNFTPNLSLALGGRYSHDDNGQIISYPTISSVPLTGQSYTFVATGAAPTAAFRSGSVAGDKFTYRIAPQVKLNRDVMIYGSYSTGYKPAGIAFVGNKYDPYNAETVESFEFGEKAELFNHRVRLNADVYLANFTNFQATILTPVSTGIGGFILASAIGNAPGLRSRGFDISAQVKPAKALTLNGSFGYNESWFTSYNSNPSTGTANYTGTSLTNAPNFTASASADYEDNVAPDLKLKAHIDYYYRSHIQTVTGALLGNLTAAAVVNADGTKTPNSSYAFVPAYSLVNARVSLVVPRSNIEAGVYVRNLFNKYFSTGWQLYGALGLLHYQTPDAYRTVGVFAKVSF